MKLLTLLQKGTWNNGKEPSKDKDYQKLDLEINYDGYIVIHLTIAKPNVYSTPEESEQKCQELYTELADDLQKYSLKVKANLPPKQKDFYRDKNTLIITKNGINEFRNYYATSNPIPETAVTVLPVLNIAGLTGNDKSHVKDCMSSLIAAKIFLAYAPSSSNVRAPYIYTLNENYNQGKMGDIFYEMFSVGIAFLLSKQRGSIVIKKDFEMRGIEKSTTAILINAGEFTRLKIVLDSSGSITPPASPQQSKPQLLEPAAASPAPEHLITPIGTVALSPPRFPAEPLPAQVVINPSASVTATSADPSSALPNSAEKIVVGAKERHKDSQLLNEEINMKLLDLLKKGALTFQVEEQGSKYQENISLGINDNESALFIQITVEQIKDAKEVKDDKGNADKSNDIAEQLSARLMQEMTDYRLVLGPDFTYNKVSHSIKITEKGLQTLQDYCVNKSDEKQIIEPILMLVKLYSRDPIDSVNYLLSSKIILRTQETRIKTDPHSPLNYKYFINPDFIGPDAGELHKHFISGFATASSKLLRKRIASNQVTVNNKNFRIVTLSAEFQTELVNKWGILDLRSETPAAANNADLAGGTGSPERESSPPHVSGALASSAAAAASPIAEPLSPPAAAASPAANALTPERKDTPARGSLPTELSFPDTPPPADPAPAAAPAIPVRLKRKEDIYLADDGSSDGIIGKPPTTGAASTAQPTASAVSPAPAAVGKSGAQKPPAQPVDLFAGLPPSGGAGVVPQSGGAAAAKPAATAAQPESSAEPKKSGWSLFDFVPDAIKPDAYKSSTSPAKTPTPVSGPFPVAKTYAAAVVSSDGRKPAAPVASDAPKRPSPSASATGAQSKPADLPTPSVAPPYTAASQSAVEPTGPATSSVAAPIPAADTGAAGAKPTASDSTDAATATSSDSAAAASEPRKSNPPNRPAPMAPLKAVAPTGPAALAAGAATGDGAGSKPAPSAEPQASAPPVPPSTAAATGDGSGGKPAPSAEPPASAPPVPPSTAAATGDGSGSKPAPSAEPPASAPPPVPPSTAAATGDGSGSKPAPSAKPPASALPVPLSTAAATGDGSGSKPVPSAKPPASALPVPPSTAAATGDGSGSKPAPSAKPPASALPVPPSTAVATGDGAGSKPAPSAEPPASALPVPPSIAAATGDGAGSKPAPSAKPPASALPVPPSTAAATGDGAGSKPAPSAKPPASALPVPPSTAAATGDGAGSKPAPSAKPPASVLPVPPSTAAATGDGAGSKPAPLAPPVSSAATASPAAAATGSGSGSKPAPLPTPSAKPPATSAPVGGSGTASKPPTAAQPAASAASSSAPPRSVPQPVAGVGRGTAVDSAAGVFASQPPAPAGARMQSGSYSPASALEQRQPQPAGRGAGSNAAAPLALAADPRRLAGSPVSQSGPGPSSGANDAPPISLQSALTKPIRSSRTKSVTVLELEQRFNTGIERVVNFQTAKAHLDHYIFNNPLRPYSAKDAIHNLIVNVFAGVLNRYQSSADRNIIDELCDLYDYVRDPLKKEKINLQAHPWWDTIFSKPNTNSWQEIVEWIRKEATTQLFLYAETTHVHDLTQRANLLQRYRDRSLFAEHTNNKYLATIGRTKAVSDIDKRIEALRQPPRRGHNRGASLG